ncbi:MAG: DASH complex subunit dam1 [Stictis urceolatum]|nr:DASH complex subunit dam1 [Stictis urceolata]
MSTTRPRSTSHTRAPPSRPTTPLRPSSRSSLHSNRSSQHGATSSTPLANLEPAFAELADSMADLEANFMHLQLMHESLSRFGESFASFLYGLNMNVFCVDFPEAPVEESWKRDRVRGEREGVVQREGQGVGEFEGDQTFLTSDTSFAENPPSTKSGSRFGTPAKTPRTPGRAGRQAGGIGRGRGIPRGTGRGTRGSGLARAKPRGAR